MFHRHSTEFLAELMREQRRTNQKWVWKSITAATSVVCCWKKNSLTVTTTGTSFPHTRNAMLMTHKIVQHNSLITRVDYSDYIICIEDKTRTAEIFFIFCAAAGQSYRCCCGCLAAFCCCCCCWLDYYKTLLHHTQAHESLLQSHTHTHWQKSICCCLLQSTSTAAILFYLWW